MTLGPWGFDFGLKVLIELLCIHAISKVQVQAILP